MVLTHFERKTLIDYTCKTVLMNLLIKKYILLSVISIEYSKTLKYLTFSTKN